MDPQKNDSLGGFIIANSNISMSKSNAGTYSWLEINGSTHMCNVHSVNARRDLMFLDLCALYAPNNLNVHSADCIWLFVILYFAFMSWIQCIFCEIDLILFSSLITHKKVNDTHSSVTSVLLYSANLLINQRQFHNMLCTWHFIRALMLVLLGCTRTRNVFPPWCRASS